jgi:AGZA family xanthine/uracil permease-like MFS transporter
VEGANSAGDNYDARLVVACDGVGTLLCGAGGSIITPVVAALHPPYKVMGARIGFCFWTAVIFLAVFMSGISLFMAQLFPWAILASMIAYVAIGVGRATLHRVDHKYITAVLLGLVLPAGAVVSSAVSSALPALKLSAANPEVQAALNRSIYWSSIQGLGNGFLFLVLVVSALITEMIDRNFGRAALWCVIASVFSWFGLMHSPILHWGAEPMYAAGWLAAAFIVFSARWWRGDLATAG